MRVLLNVAENQKPDSEKMTVLDRIFEIQAQLKCFAPLKQDLPEEEKARLFGLIAELAILRQRRDFNKRWLKGGEYNGEST